MRSKKLFINILVVAALSANLAYADVSESDVQAKIANFESEKQASLDRASAEQDAFAQNVRTKIRNFKGERKITLTSEKKLDISQIVENIFAKLGNTIARLQILDTNTKGAISSKKSSGFDTSSTDEALIAAEAKLADASTNIASIKSGIESAVSDGTVTREGISTFVKQAADIVKDARASFGDAIKSLAESKLAEISAPEEPSLSIEEASTTATTTEESEPEASSTDISTDTDTASTTE
ncbi:MAG: hypothetical protein V4438_00360 [Patescibacteria group bacterium]